MILFSCRKTCAVAERLRHWTLGPEGAGSNLGSGSSCLFPLLSIRVEIAVTFLWADERTSVRCLLLRRTLLGTIPMVTMAQIAAN